MKSLYVLLIVFMFGLGFAVAQDQAHLTTINPIEQKADEPGTGNDGEDTSERSFMCRLFNIFCSDN